MRSQKLLLKRKSVASRKERKTNLSLGTCHPFSGSHWIVIMYWAEKFLSNSNIFILYQLKSENSDIELIQDLTRIQNDTLLLQADKSDFLRGRSGGSKENAPNQCDKLVPYFSLIYSDSILWTVPLPTIVHLVDKNVTNCKNHRNSNLAFGIGLFEMEGMEKAVASHALWRPRPLLWALFRQARKCCKICDVDSTLQNL